ncbi:MAG: cation:proton antiporter [Gammaproteobacteria bacterium]|nr:cation:proton antiporter [Gammaproteobacteria bacterium]
MDTDSLLINAMYYLLAAVIAVPFFKKIGLGSILGYLCAGIVLGPHALGVISDPDQVLHFAEYGVILLLFVIGLELAPNKLWNMRSHIGLIGGSQLLLSTVVIGGLMLFLSFSFSQSLVLGLTLALSSTAFAIQLMKEEHILASPLGRKGFGILLMQDLAVIPILVLVGVLALSGSGESEAPPWYYGVIAILLVLAVSRFGLNTVLGIVAGTNNREVMTAASLLIVISVAVLMEAVGLSMGLGAFLAGILLANSNFRHQLESDIEPFKGILLGLFFIAVGMTLNLPLLYANPLLMIVGALALVATKTLVIVGILRWRKISFKESFQLGLMLSQGGEFAFVVLSSATELKLFTAELTDQITLIVGLSMALTSPLVVIQRKIWHRRREAIPEQSAYWADHDPEVIIAGFGRFGQIVGRMLQARHVPFTAMDKDSVHVEFVKQFGNRLFYGDLTRLDLLLSAGVKKARILVLAVDNVEESLQIVDLAREQNPDIRIVARAIDRFHAYELHKRDVQNVIRETFASSLEAATDTLEHLGYTEGQALEVTSMFRKHDEEILSRSAKHMDDLAELQNLAKEGRMELEKLFEEDSKNTVSS